MKAEKIKAATEYFKAHCVKHNCRPIVRTNIKKQTEFWFKRDGHALSEFYGFAHDVAEILTEKA